MPIAPMIDCVFLLLIYFLVATSLQQEEADIAFQLPGVVEQLEPLVMPDEQIIEVTAEGQVIVNEFPYDHPEATRFDELAAMLNRFRQTSEANQTTAQVTVAPNDKAHHQSIVKVMDAIARAGITGVHFSLGDQEKVSF